jgi:hypothetical protein
MKNIRCQRGLIFQSTILVWWTRNAGGYILTGKIDNSALTAQSPLWQAVAPHRTTPLQAPVSHWPSQYCNTWQHRTLDWDLRLNYFAWDFCRACVYVDPCGRQCVRDAVLEPAVQKLYSTLYLFIFKPFLLLFFVTAYTRGNIKAYALYTFGGYWQD